MSLYSKIQEEPTIFLFRTWWRFAGKERPLLLWAVFCLTIAFSIRLLEPLILAHLIDFIQEEGVSRDNFWQIMFIVSWFFWAVFAFSVIRSIGEYFKNNTAFITHNNYRKYLFKKIINRNLTWANDNESGDIIDKTKTSSQALYQFGRNSQRSIDILVRFIGSYIALGLFFFPTLFIAPVVLLPLWLIIYSIDLKLIPYYKKLNLIENNISAKIFDAFSNITSVIVLGLRKEVTQGLKRKIDEPVTLYKEHMLLMRMKWTLTGTCFYIVIVLVIGLYIYLNLDSPSAVTAGTISALFLYLLRMGFGFYDLVGSYGDLIKYKTDLANAEPLLTDEYQDNPRGERIFVSKNIGISDLHFNYQIDDTLTTALQDINLTISKGEKIALVGESGSGKTTFLKVLHGLYDTAHVDLCVDDKKIDKQLHEVYFGTTLVPQEPELFSASINENITFGLDIEQKKIDTVCRLAEFDTVVTQLPHGYESKINEKGVNLYGGQKQRLALARALLFAQNKDVILLDESTSSVDPETEVKIYNNIFEEFKGKTFLASIHKLNLLKYFDRIVIFREGTISATGTFDELLNSDPMFANMWEDFVAEQARGSKG